MLTPSRQLTDAEKLRKVISELVDTERAYVKVAFYLKLMFLFAATSIPQMNFIWDTAYQRVFV